MLQDTQAASKAGIDAHGLRVAHISATRGGVANAARRLHLGLLEVGAESTIFTSKAPGDAQLPGMAVVPQPNTALHYADQASRLLHKHFGLTGLTHVSSLTWDFDGYDVLHFHGAADNWFNLRALRRLNRTHALVWTMHDKHLGTGGCGYPEVLGDCQRWRTGCGQACPKAKAEGWKVDLTAQTFRQKQALLNEIRLGIAAPSQWMYDFIAASAITRNALLRRIPYGMDTERFHPYPMAEARRAFGLPVEGRLLLTVASKLGQLRKGLHLLPGILRELRAQMPDEPLALALVGDELPEEMLAELNAILPAYALGHISDGDSLAQVYSAADVFVMTSLMDNFPNVILESLACGTPVAGFNVGGIPDMIVPGETGVLAGAEDTAAMAAGVADILSDMARLAQMRAACRQRALTDYSLAAQAGRYIEFYRELLQLKQGGQHP